MQDPLLVVSSVDTTATCPSTFRGDSGDLCIVLCAWLCTLCGCIVKSFAKEGLWTSLWLRRVAEKFRAVAERCINATGRGRGLCGKFGRTYRYFFVVYEDCLLYARLLLMAWHHSYSLDWFCFFEVTSNPRTFFCANCLLRGSWRRCSCTLRTASTGGSLLLLWQCKKLLKRTLWGCSRTRTSGRSTGSAWRSCRRTCSSLVAFVDFNANEH